jgi:ABC-type bacteriocin/lantibiotic exporter with double-glycine peptidase domain
MAYHGCFFGSRRAAWAETIVGCVLVLTLFLAGCASRSLKGIRIDAADLESIPDSIRHDVPFIAQNDNYSCATTSLAMAISYYEDGTTAIDKDSAWQISGIDRETVRKMGNDMAGLERLATHFGYESEYGNRLSISTLEFLLSQNALIVLNIRASRTGRQTHAVLATGYNRTRETLYINDPGDSPKEMSYADLEARWSAYLSNPRGMSRRSGFVVYP